jgi:hypothetical protein
MRIARSDVHWTICKVGWIRIPAFVCPYAIPAVWIGFSHSTWERNESHSVWVILLVITTWVYRDIRALVRNWINWRWIPAIHHGHRSSQSLAWSSHVSCTWLDLPKDSWPDRFPSWWLINIVSSSVYDPSSDRLFRENVIIMVTWDLSQI